MSSEPHNATWHMNTHTHFLKETIVVVFFLFFELQPCTPCLLHNPLAHGGLIHLTVVSILGGVSSRTVQHLRGILHSTDLLLALISHSIRHPNPQCLCCAKKICSSTVRVMPDSLSRDICRCHAVSGWW